MVRAVQMESSGNSLDLRMYTVHDIIPPFVQPGFHVNLYSLMYSTCSSTKKQRTGNPDHVGNTMFEVSSKLRV